MSKGWYMKVLENIGENTDGSFMLSSYSAMTAIYFQSVGL